LTEWDESVSVAQQMMEIPRESLGGEEIDALAFLRLQEVTLTTVP